MLCDQALYARIRDNLAAFEPRTADGDGRRAAVAVTVTDAGLGADLPGLPRHRQWQREIGRAHV